jgi:hypothetical protein
MLELSKGRFFPPQTYGFFFDRKLYGNKAAQKATGFTMTILLVTTNACYTLTDL